MKKHLPLALSLAVLLPSCIATRPAGGVIHADGTRSGTSKQIVFLRTYDAAAAADVAQDAAGITTLTGVEGVKRRARAFGSAYITTVTGK